MKNQVGAKYLKNQRAELRLRELLVLNSIKYESDLVRLANGVVKRVKRQAD